LSEEVCPEPIEIDKERKLAIFWDRTLALKYAECLGQKDGKYHAMREETVAIVPPTGVVPPIALPRKPLRQFVVSLRGIDREHLKKMIARAKEAS